MNDQAQSLTATCSIQSMLIGTGSRGPLWNTLTSRWLAKECGHICIAGTLPMWLSAESSSKTHSQSRITPTARLGKTIRTSSLQICLPLEEWSRPRWFRPPVRGLILPTIATVSSWICTNRWRRQTLSTCKWRLAGSSAGRPQRWHQTSSKYWAVAVTTMALRKTHTLGTISTWSPVMKGTFSLKRFQVPLEIHWSLLETSWR